MRAAEKGHTDIVKALLAHGADVNAKEPHGASAGATALMYAVVAGHNDIVQVLLTHGADVNARENKVGFTALMGAAYNGQTNAVQALVAHGADVNAKNNDGDTALMLAKKKGHKEIVRILKEAGAKE